jgi:hypothetical protein
MAHKIIQWWYGFIIPETKLAVDPAPLSPLLPESHTVILIFDFLPLLGF